MSIERAFRCFAVYPQFECGIYKKKFFNFQDRSTKNYRSVTKIIKSKLIVTMNIWRGRTLIMWSSRGEGGAKQDITYIFFTFFKFWYTEIYRSQIYRKPNFELISILCDITKIWKNQTYGRCQKHLFAQ